MLHETIRSAMQAAMKERDPLLNTYRSILAACTNLVLEKGRRPDAVPTDEEVIVVLQRLVKQHREAAEGFRSGNNEERAVSEEKEGALVASYLPALLPEDEVRSVVVRLQGEMQVTAGDRGKLIGAVMKELGSKTDGTTVNRLVGEVIGD